MSGICGIINFDQRPVERELLVRMAGRASYRGKDGIHYYLKGEVGLAHLALHTTPESKVETQPLVNKDRGLVLVADARVDDRKFLIQKLKGKINQLSKTPTDAELIMAAYIVWAEHCTKHLLGDFAFVLWDSHNRKLYAARDRAGCRGFYYRWTNNSFSFATEASQLLADNSYSPVLNRHVIARDLVLPGHGGRHMSYYQGIEKLGSGEYLKVNYDQLTQTQYYRPEPGSTINYQDSREYAEHFRELLNQCVGDRLRCEGQIGLFLSGGLDSAAIAAIAGAQITNNQSTNTKNIKCINWTYGNNHQANEKNYAQAVASRWGLSLEEYSVLDNAPLYNYPEYQFHPDEPYNSPISSFFHATLEHYSQYSNFPKVWMNGINGDALIGGPNPFYFSRLMKKGQIIKMVRELYLQKQAYKLNWLQALSYSYVSPLILRPLRQRVHRWRKGRRAYARNWISPQLLEQTKTYDWLMSLQMPEWVEINNSDSQIKDSALAFRSRVLNCNVGERLRVWFERSTAQFGAESWNPWEDSRLADFVLSIPQDQIAQGLNHKLILRNSLVDVLPDGLVNRREGRTGPGLYLEQGFRKNSAKAVEEITNTMRSEQLGMINSRIFKHNLALFFQDRAAYDKAAWITLSLEIWLQQHNF